MAESVYSSQTSLLADPSIENPGYGSNDDRQDLTCICHEEILLDDESISQLEKGDHISRPLQCCGGYTHCCFHHAILDADISEIHQNPDVSFKFISFSESDEGGKAKIILKQESLDYTQMDIYKIVYKHPKYRGEQVTRNVENLMEKGIPYHACLNNCEHICRGCVTGEEKSIQVDTLDKCCAQSVFGCLPRLLRLALAIVSTIFDDLYDLYSKNNVCIIGIQSFALTVYLYLLLRQLVNSQFQHSLKKMCENCLKSSSRKFLFGLVFIMLSVAGIIVDETKYNRIAPVLAVLALLFWLITELCNVCSERCHRNTTRCICMCSIFTCCCFNKCYNASCGKCCKCHAFSKCCQCIMDLLDSICYYILNLCWLLLKRCLKLLKRRCDNND